MSENKCGRYRPVKNKQRSVPFNITRTAADSVHGTRHNIIVLYESNDNGFDSDAQTKNSDEEDENIRENEDDISRPLSYYDDKNTGSSKQDEPPEPPIMKEPTSERLSVPALAEAGIIAVIAAILGYIGTSVSAVAVFVPLILPVPIAMVTLRRGLYGGIICSVATALLLVIILDPTKALLTGWQIITIGILFGYRIRCAKKPLPTILGGTALSALSTIAGFALSLRSEGLTLAHIIEDLRIIVNEVVRVQSNMGAIIPEQYAANLVAILTDLLPGIVITGSVLTVIAAYWITAKVSRRLGYMVRSAPKFHEWRMPWQSVWGVIIGVILCFIGSGADGILYSVLYSVGINILYLYGLLLFMAGLALCVWILRNYYFSLFFKAMIVITFLLCFDVTVILFVLLGLFDPFIDIRSRNRKKSARAK